MVCHHAAPQAPREISGLTFPHTPEARKGGLLTLEGTAQPRNLTGQQGDRLQSL